MISCLLIQVSRNQQGAQVSKENVIVGESIQIGRGAACKIHLLDHRVNLLHATIKRSENGAVFIEGEKDVTLCVNGFVENSALIPPATRIEIGPYLLIVQSAPDGHDIAISVEMILPLPEKNRTKIPVTLSGLGLCNRKLGLVSAALILFVFLLLPLLPSIFPALDKGQNAFPVALNESWSAGPLSNGHRMLGKKCSACHQHAFRAVSNDVCLGCHKLIKLHLSKVELLHVEAIKNMLCTECHLDHGGSKGLLPQNSSSCVACHADIKKKNSMSTLANVHDFDVDHQQFQVQLRDGKNTTRVRLDEQKRLVEKSGLKFSHQVHLDPKGVSSPQGDTIMACRDCHKIEQSGIGFAPMTMRKTCQQSRCHELEFTEPVEGEVPHGSEHVVMDSLRTFYTKWLSDSPKNLAMCERIEGSITQRTWDCANELARKNAAATLFREKLECGECHEIQASEDKETPWMIKKLYVKTDWHPMATFVHSKHGTMGCTDCHDKMNSKASADVSMPRIEKCRECHVGDHSAKGKISSDCDSCHRFHRGDK